MANDEYQIPSQYSEPEVRAELEAIIDREMERAPIARIKAAEKKVFSYRETAAEMKRPQTTWLRGNLFTPRPETVASWIDKESHLGGALFGPGHRFWLDAQPASSGAEEVPVDWYHSQTNPANPSHPIVLRFQTTSNAIHKLYEGREYPPSQQDVDTFVRAVEAYKDAVLPLYPVDQVLEDLSGEDGSLYDDIAA